MIAQVVPITRLRRDTSWWSYLIPPRTACQPGSLVVIPFRGGRVLGVVWHIEDSDGAASKSIEEVLTPLPLVRAPHRQVIERMSELGLCSLSTALYQWLPGGLHGFPLSKGARIQLRAYNVWQTAFQKSGLAPKQHCVLVPTRRDGSARQLQARFGQSFCQFLGDSTPDQELNAWFAIAKGDIRLVLGRERALFAPWLNLSELTIIEPEDIGYYHEQIPYCSLLDIAKAAALSAGASLTYKSCLPSEAAQALWGDTAQGLEAWPPSLTLTDLSQTPVLGPSLIEAIKATLKSGRRVLLLYNAKDKLIDDPEEKSGEKILLPGIETLAKKLAHLLDVPELPGAVILGTRSLFQEQHQNIGLTVVLSLDPLLRQTIFADHMHGLADLGHLFSYQVPCIVQSHGQDHPLIQALRNRRLAEYATQYVKQQEELCLPPFGQQIIASIPLEGAEKTAQELYELLEPLMREPWQISYPFSGRWRKKQYLHVMLHTEDDKARLPVGVRSQLAKLSRPWKVQHNPWYIL